MTTKPITRDEFIQKFVDAFWDELTEKGNGNIGWIENQRVILVETAAEQYDGSAEGGHVVTEDVLERVIDFEKEKNERIEYEAERERNWSE